jgi:hypothetical protein
MINYTVPYQNAIETIVQLHWNIYVYFNGIAHIFIIIDLFYVSNTAPLFIENYYYNHGLQVQNNTLARVYSYYWWWWWL